MKGMIKLARKKKEIQWFDINELFAEHPDGQYYICFSGRGKGKSYSTYKYIIDDYFKNGHQGFIMKRFESDLKGSRVSNLFSPLDEYVWDTYQMKIRYWRNAFYFYIPTEDNKMPPITECELFCHTGALNISDRLKAMNYPDVKTIVLEEFMSMSCRYLTDEVNLLLNIVSTVFRHRVDGKVIMLGNSISKYDPYSQMLGIKLYEIPHGEVKHLTFKNEKGQQTNFIIHRATNVDVFDNEENKEQIIFNQFGQNDIGAMISSGEFQTGEFPHHIHGYFITEIKEREYKRMIDKNIRLVGQFKVEDNTPFFIKFDSQYYQARLVKGTTSEEYFKLNGQTLVSFHPVSENYFLNHNSQGCKKWKLPCNIVMTHLNEHIDTFYPTIVYHNFNYQCKVQGVNVLIDEIMKAFNHQTVCYLDNATGQDIQNVFKLMGGI